MIHNKQYKKGVPFLCIYISILFTSCGLWGDIADLRPVILKGITITAYPDRTNYFLGEENLDLTGLVVTAAYSNGSSTAIENFSYTGFYSDTLGNRTIIFSYQGFTAEFTVLVAMIIFNASDVVSYLATMPDKGDTVCNPAFLPMQIDLGTMTGTGSGWRRLLNAINEAGKYVDLDLSACTMNGTVFDPDNYNVSIGKNYIVSLALPDAALAVSPNNYPNIRGSFFYFDALSFVSGTSIETIGADAFSYLENLVDVSFPAAVTIERNAFYRTGLVDVTFPAAVKVGEMAFFACTELVRVSFPAATEIGVLAFWENTNLTGVNIPAVELIDECAFRETGSAALTIIMGEKAPDLGEYLFWDINVPKTVTLRIPYAAADYDSEWQDNFKGGNPNITLNFEYH